MASDKRPLVYDDFLPFFPDASGNDVNGLGEKDIRRPLPFFGIRRTNMRLGSFSAKSLGFSGGPPTSRNIIPMMPPEARPRLKNPGPKPKNHQKTGPRT